jgi:hypothetical protein
VSSEGTPATDLIKDFKAIQEDAKGLRQSIEVKFNDLETAINAFVQKKGGSSPAPSGGG